MPFDGQTLDKIRVCALFVRWRLRKVFLRLSWVTRPVALYPATLESEKISFNQLNRQTGHRIRLPCCPQPRPSLATIRAVGGLAEIVGEGWEFLAASLRSVASTGVLLVGRQQIPRTKRFSRNVQPDFSRDSASVPSVERNHPRFLVEAGTNRILVDAHDDFWSFATYRATATPRSRCERSRQGIIPPCRRVYGYMSDFRHVKSASGSGLLR